jgi:hypothetical protein
MNALASADRPLSTGRKAILAIMAGTVVLYALSMFVPDPKLATVFWKAGNYGLGNVLGYFADQMALYYMRPHRLTGLSRDIAALRRVLAMQVGGIAIAWGL